MLADTRSPDPTDNVSLDSRESLAIRAVAVSRLIEASASDREQLLAVWREAHLARRPIEQAKPELAFQLSDHHAQARRRDEERARGTRERMVLGDEQKRAKLP